MYRLTHIDSGFEWSFATLAEAIEYLETFERQEEFEIRRQTARSIFFIPLHRTYVRVARADDPGAIVKNLTRLFRYKNIKRG